MNSKIWKYDAWFPRSDNVDIQITCAPIKHDYDMKEKIIKMLENSTGGWVFPADYGLPIEKHLAILGVKLEDKKMTCNLKTDFSKPVKTRSGKKVRIVCTDKKGEEPIVALISDDRNETYEDVITYSSCGHIFFDCQDDENDLINITSIDWSKPIYAVDDKGNVYPAILDRKCQNGAIVKLKGLNIKGINIKDINSSIWHSDNEGSVLISVFPYAEIHLKIKNFE